MSGRQVVERQLREVAVQALSHWEPGDDLGQFGRAISKAMQAGFMRGFRIAVAAHQVGDEFFVAMKPLLTEAGFDPVLVRIPVTPGTA